MYEAVTVGDRATASRLATTAADCGYDGIVLRNGHERTSAVETVVDQTGIDIAVGAELDEDDPATLRGHIGRLANEVECLIVRGGSVRLNRLAVTTPTVDVLAAPMAGRGDINHVLARAAADNDVALEMDLGPVLRASGAPRVRAIHGLRKLVEIADDAGAPLVASGSPTDHLGIRSPRALAAIGDTIGVGSDRIEAGLARWGEIVAAARHRNTPETIAEGIRRGEEGSE